MTDGIVEFAEVNTNHGYRIPDSHVLSSNFLQLSLHSTLY